MEYLLDAFDDEEKQGDDRARDIDVSVTLVAQFLLSLLAFGDDDDKYLSIFKYNNHSIESFIGNLEPEQRITGSELTMCSFW